MGIFIFFLSFFFTAIRNVELIALCGGIKVLFSTLLEGPTELADTIVMTVLYILDSDKTRCFLRPSVELEVRGKKILKFFSELYCHIVFRFTFPLSLMIFPLTVSQFPYLNIFLYIGYHIQFHRCL